MASSSSSLSRTWRYRVFASFHGPDVRKTFLSHLRRQFEDHGISMFDDQGIERGETIAPALTRAIRESRISIVVVSKNYASSRWCLDELLEILKCKEDIGQIVMTVFYDVNPSDVRKQTGDFGIVFNETCSHKTEERQRWSQALKDVGNIAGEHLLNWDDESKMIQKISRDISNKLNFTIPRDFEDKVGIEEHLQKMQSLLHLDDEDRVMIVGIWGPAGIGKTTIARALHSQLSSSFQLTCFMENIRGSYNSGLDEYGLKLILQGQLLSKILNQDGMKIHHLGAILERLCDQKVLIVLDDVDDLKQLEALANEPNWFGPGSRIIVTTENQELLQQHDIDNMYRVRFPSDEEALKILCKYAFRQSSAPHDFKKLAKRVTELCSKLPLGLEVIGSSLRGKDREDWEEILQRLENSLDPVDQRIEKVLRVGYDGLDATNQLLFLFIAFFFNYKDGDHVKTMLAQVNLSVRLGLKTLAYKSLIHISTEGYIVMHKLLQQVGRQAVQRQDDSRRQFLIDTNDIRDVLQNDHGSRYPKVMGISFDMSTMLGEMEISPGAFKIMPNLEFIQVYNARCHGNDRVRVPEVMEFPPRLKLLHWEAYPGKYLHHTFHPEYLVELSLVHNRFEKLWQGTQPLANLKKMNLTASKNLKELPDLSNAMKLEELDLSHSESLLEVPTSVGNLARLESLQMAFCIKLQVVPTLLNLSSLKLVNMVGCWQLKNFPPISGNITELTILDTMLEGLPDSVRHWPCLISLCIFGSLNTLPDLPEDILLRNGPDIEKIPDCIKDLHGLKNLSIYGCPKLASLPELPGSLRRLTVDTCGSLEVVSFSFDPPVMELYFPNCYKLGREARRTIAQQAGHVNTYLPGRKMPKEFDMASILGFIQNFFANRARPAFFRFRICFVVFQISQAVLDKAELLCRISLNGNIVDENIVEELPDIRNEHLVIFQSKSFSVHEWLQLDNEIVFQLSDTSENINAIETGVRILTSEMEESGDWRNPVSEDDYDLGYELQPNEVLV